MSCQCLSTRVRPLSLMPWSATHSFHFPWTVYSHSMSTWESGWDPFCYAGQCSMKLNFLNCHCWIFAPQIPGLWLKSWVGSAIDRSSGCQAPRGLRCLQPLQDARLPWDIHHLIPSCGFICWCAGLGRWELWRCKGGGVCLVPVYFPTIFMRSWGLCAIYSLVLRSPPFDHLELREELHCPYPLFWLLTRNVNNHTLILGDYSSHTIFDKPSHQGQAIHHWWHH